jgi:hypothetical protein
MLREISDFFFGAKKVGFFWFETKIVKQNDAIKCLESKQKIWGKTERFFLLKRKKFYFSFRFEAKIILSKKNEKLYAKWNEKKRKIGPFFRLTLE